MLYCFIGNDFENSLEQRLKTRPKHVARLKALQAQGRLIIAGPNPAIDSSDPGDAGFSGSIIIAEFDSLDDAQNWADEEPYIIDGVYSSVTIRPFIQALP